MVNDGNKNEKKVLRKELYVYRTVFIPQRKVGERVHHHSPSVPEKEMLPYLLRYARGLSPKYFVNKRVK